MVTIDRLAPDLLSSTRQVRSHMRFDRAGSGLLFEYLRIASAQKEKEKDPLEEFFVCASRPCKQQACQALTSLTALLC